MAGLIGSIVGTPQMKGMSFMERLLATQAPETYKLLQGKREEQETRALIDQLINSGSPAATMNFGGQPGMPSNPGMKYASQVQIPGEMFGRPAAAEDINNMKLLGKIAPEAVANVFASNVLAPYKSPELKTLNAGDTMGAVIGGKFNPLFTAPKTEAQDAEIQRAMFATGGNENAARALMRRKLTPSDGDTGLGKRYANTFGGDVPAGFMPDTSGGQLTGKVIPVRADQIFYRRIIRAHVIRRSCAAYISCAGIPSVGVLDAVSSWVLLRELCNGLRRIAYVLDAFE